MPYGSVLREKLYLDEYVKMLGQKQTAQGLEIEA